ncbi:hypothetical protein M427DRAFT_74518 [Gonapodya prolifera JEL478]|uniref:Uncharacterized protein n=1 Tax=Gonapodya prolifera (strain JEL478) TaxID=1344416 RepID=A0A139A0T3_GONPJ|nr:hypothetical protein M427DRAFT_74518 [Gonapodya prolifera JEL478]|eukprot:KXS10135.1 hypothetical protein M427DRAFT_74518 [Gonapodya prolifera JEL478]
MADIGGVNVAPKMEERAFPMLRLDGASGSFMPEPVLFDFHPVYGREMGLSKGEPLANAVFFKLDDKQAIPIDAFPSPLYLLVLRGTLSVKTPAKATTTFTAGGFFHVPSPSSSHATLAANKGSPVLALALIKNAISPSSFFTLPKDRTNVSEDFRFTALVVTPAGGSAVSDDHAVGKLDSLWKLKGADVVASTPYETLAISFCDAVPTLTAPLHPAYSKYVNWTTFLGPGRAQFQVTEGNPPNRNVGAGDIIWFEDSEGAGHGYRVVGAHGVSQVFVTLKREVRKWGVGKSGFEAGLHGLSWEQVEEKKKLDRDGKL